MMTIIVDQCQSDFLASSTSLLDKYNIRVITHTMWALSHSIFVKNGTIF